MSHVKAVKATSAVIGGAFAYKQYGGTTQNGGSEMAGTGYDGGAVQNGGVGTKYQAQTEFTQNSGFNQNGGGQGFGTNAPVGGGGRNDFGYNQYNGDNRLNNVDDKLMMGQRSDEKRDTINQMMLWKW
eukprot:TRINITY_DN13848_c0_g1_i2.p2 TRINITY_DN13848_c0_g1~~TRINITY_DN13848_c0_g1_i2.p2  ORF type:complete len:128 (+),score=31.87 TRINITY_DN13848_c0_g1_i2:84-467(+)